MWEPQLHWGSTPPDRQSPPEMASPSPAEMDASQRLYLRWNNHGSHLTQYINDEFYKTSTCESSTLTDVTLAFEDGVKIQAHRLILAASSPYFRELFISADESAQGLNAHPCLIFKDVRSLDMKLLLAYMYKGEVELQKKELKGLLSIAKSLKVRGLEEAISINDFTNKSAEKTSLSSMDAEDRSMTSLEAFERSRIHDALESEYLNNMKFSGSSAFTEVMKEKLRSKSSTPLSRHESPAPLSHKKEYLPHSPSSSESPSPSDERPSSQRPMMIPSSVLSPSLTFYPPSLDRHLNRPDVLSSDRRDIKRASSPDGDHLPVNLGHSIHPCWMNSQPSSPQSKRKCVSPPPLPQSLFPSSSFHSSFPSFNFPLMQAVGPSASPLDILGRNNFPQIPRIGSVSVKKDLAANDDFSNYPDDDQVRSGRHSPTPDLSSYWRSTGLLPTSAYPQNPHRKRPCVSPPLKTEESIHETDSNLVNGSSESSNFNLSDTTTSRNAGVPTSTSAVPYSSPSYAPYVNGGSGGGGNHKPEWKRYKQYSKEDLNLAIDAVKNGTTALQASRQYKVPSRTLYDKIKKLGISTTPRRITSTMSSQPNKLRHHPRHDSGRLTPPRVDNLGVVHHSGGALVTSSSNPGYPVKDHKDSRSHSAEPATGRDSCPPFSAHPSKTYATDNPVPSFASNVEVDLRKFCPNVSRFDQNPHENIGGSSGLFGLSEYTSKSVLDLLPRDLSSRGSEALKEKLPYPSWSVTSSLTAEHLKPGNDYLPPGNDYLLPGSDYLHRMRSRINLKLPELVSMSNGERENRSSLHEKTNMPRETEISLTKVKEEEELLVVDDLKESDQKQEMITRTHSDKSPTSETTTCEQYSRDDSSKTTMDPRLSDSSPSSTAAVDSGHDSNNTSAASDSYLRTQGPPGLPFVGSPVSPRNTTPITAVATSPKTSEPSTSSAEVSPMLSNKSSLCVDSDTEMNVDRSSVSVYTSIPDTGLCAQIRPLDLRDNSISIP
ncbi:uncharacterized protein LOC108673796 isoform X1 [Hyalella azteca]|uniref:Uncharacterized protein LOC108673796 isoform X1 n=2 Tax=Hyalella azteca TaxID=294128 RepID=A0A8B7NW55_HYAAZ|nr:uncharacterized protein LOC108673796 isoform X1 [Hyalella azteca]